MRIPLFRTSLDATALAEQDQDLFYLAAFGLQNWINGLLNLAMEKYARIPDPANRSMQIGQAWRELRLVLRHVPDEGFADVMNCLVRYAQGENDVSTQLLVGLVMVYREHEFTGDFVGPEGLDPALDRTAAGLLLRRSVQRVCDWLDSKVHLGTHMLWYSYPACFDPDPEKRRRAQDEVVERETAEMDEAAVVLPYIAARGGARQQSPLPSAGPRRAVNVAERPWPFPKLDESVITLWPLLKLHNWTYADLWNVLNQGGIPLAETPCPNHRLLAEYSYRSLGLRKETGEGKTTRNGLPPGHPLALRLLSHFKRRGRGLGRVGSS